jgi:hypothetical protein
MPLPFYLVGGSQVLLGRNLWVARLTSLLVGLVAIWLTAMVAHRLGGEVAGFVTALLMASQGTIVSYYASAVYHSLTAAILMATVLVLLSSSIPWRYPIGMSIAALLFFTRTNMFPALPFFFAWAFAGASTPRQRIAVGLVASVGPIAFFLSDSRHFKLLAHIPFVHRLVEPLGYVSILQFSPVHHASGAEQLWAFVLFARRFESWTYAAAALAVVLALCWHRRFLPSRWWSPGLVAVAALFVWLLAWHFVMWRANFKMVIAYFPGFAPLVAVLLGVSFGSILRWGEAPPRVRVAARIGLAVALTVSVVFPRDPSLPRPPAIPFRGDTLQQMDSSVAALRRLVQPEARVFVFAQPMVAYLAGLRPPLQQLMSPGGTLAPADADPHVVSRSGVWGRAELDRWLGQEADYAVVSDSLISALEGVRTQSMRRMRELLAEHFVAIGQVDEPGPRTSVVYRRRGSI